MSIIGSIVNDRVVDEVQDIIYHLKVKYRDTAEGRYATELLSKVHDEVEKLRGDE